MRLIETGGIVKHLGYSPAGRLVFAETYLFPWKLHSQNLGQGHGSWTVDLKEAAQVWLSLSAGLVAAAEKSGAIKIYRLRDDGIDEYATVDGWQVNQWHPASFSGNGRYAAWYCPPQAETPHRILWREIDQAKTAGSFQPYEHTELLQFSDDGNLLFTAGGRSLTAWSMKSKESVATWRIPANVSTSLLGPNYRFLACSTDGMRVCIGTKNRWFLWEPGSGKLEFEKARRFKTAAFAADSRLLAFAFGNRAEIWEMAPPRCLRAYEWPIREIFCLAFAPDGLTVAAGGIGGIVIWDVDE
jgi:WD40 repeat protein